MAAGLRADGRFRGSDESRIFRRDDTRDNDVRNWSAAHTAWGIASGPDGVLWLTEESAVSSSGEKPGRRRNAGTRSRLAARSPPPAAYPLPSSSIRLLPSLLPSTISE